VKRKIGAVLTALTLFTGVGVATATAAQAATRIGPYSTLTGCQNGMAAYTRGGRTVIINCFHLTEGWFFTLAY